MPTTRFAADSQKTSRDLRWKRTHNLNGQEIGKELSLTTESCQEKSVQEKDRGEPAKEKELQTAAEVKDHCVKGKIWHKSSQWKDGLESN